MRTLPVNVRRRVMSLAPRVDLAISIAGEVRRNGRSFRVRLSPRYARFWRNTGWEPETYEVFDRYLDRDHSYIDIGAWIGPTVLYGAQLAKHVYAIEPDPTAFLYLSRNVDLNDALRKKISLHNVCIADSDGTARMGFAYLPGDSESSLLFESEEMSWTAKSVTFDSFVKENDVRDCGFVKMDIEGGEFIVLPKMKEYLEKEHPTLYLSLHPHKSSDLSADMAKVVKVLEIYDEVRSAAGTVMLLSDLLDERGELRSRWVVASKKP